MIDVQKMLRTYLGSLAEYLDRVDELDCPDEAVQLEDYQRRVAELRGLYEEAYGLHYTL